MTHETIELSSQKKNSYRIVWFCVLVVALLQGLYAIGFIGGTSFVVEGQRYFCLFDDAMISMRYADNWANGNGLVWNPDQRVEGYTTFLWTLIMGLCHLPGLTPSHTCLLVQILGVVALWLCLAATASLAKSSGLNPVSGCIAVILTGTYYNLIFFSLFGMETGLLTAMVIFAFADTVSCLRNRRANMHVSLWLAPIVLMRPDMLPVMLICSASVIVLASRGRSKAVIGLVVSVCIVLAHLIWRHGYYGQWLPNTYYLKMTGWALTERLKVGLRQSFETILVLALPVVLAAAVLKRRSCHHSLLLGSFLFGLAYQTYVGGDAWPLSRFVIPYVPGLFILSAEAMTVLAEEITKNAAGKLRYMTITVLAFLCMINVNIIHWDHLLLLTRPQTTCDNWMNVKNVHAVRKYDFGDVTVAVTWAGVFPYFSGLECVDLLGKCEAHIAKLDAHLDVKRAGHNKYDIRYSLDTYRPDILVHFLEGDVDLHIVRDYTPVLVEVDDYEVAFAISNRDSRIRDVTKLSWDSFIEVCFRIDRDNRQFQANQH